MADERWKRLAEQQGIAYAKTVAQAMDLKLDMDNPADREKSPSSSRSCRPGEKCESKKGVVEIRAIVEACSPLNSDPVSMSEKFPV